MNSSERTLPQIPFSKVLWTLAYYDGPLSGVVEFQGRKAYFYADIDPEDPDLTYPTFWKVVELSTDEANELSVCHQLWEEFRGESDLPLNERSVRPGNREDYETALEQRGLQPSLEREAIFHERESVAFMRVEEEQVAGA